MRGKKSANTIVQGIGLYRKHCDSLISKAQNKEPMEYSLHLYDDKDELFIKLSISISAKAQSIKLHNISAADIKRLKVYFDKILSAGKTLKSHHDGFSNTKQSHEANKRASSTRKERRTVCLDCSSRREKGKSSLSEMLVGGMRLKAHAERLIIERLVKDTHEKFDVGEIARIIEVYALPKEIFILKYKRQLLNVDASKEAYRNDGLITSMKLRQENKTFMISKVSSLSNEVSASKLNAMPEVNAIMNTISIANSNKTNKFAKPKDSVVSREETNRKQQKIIIKHKANASISQAPQEIIPERKRIKIYHTDYTHHNTHNINKMIANINKFIEATFKSKEPYNTAKCLSLSNAIGIPLLKSEINDQTFKNRETGNMLKERVLRRLWSALNAENGVAAKQGRQYKFCVCGGNNPGIVKALLKSRSCWSQTESGDELNLLWTQWANAKFIQSLAKTPADIKNAKVDGNGGRVCNHLERHGELSNKKEMLANLTRYYNSVGEKVSHTLPLTFHIKEGLEDPEFKRFAETFQSKEGRNIWIVKPGENTNQGRKIHVLNTLEGVRRAVKLVKKGRSLIVQKYIEQPFLINKRKFDIRMYALFTSTNGHRKGYFYDEGYIRTSSKEFSLKNLANRAVHLTNDAVQQKEEDYGRYESGNKLSFADFQKYLDSVGGPLRVDFFKDLLPQMKKIVTDTFRAVYDVVDPWRRQNTFEIFGYDFMIDTKFKLYLIEVNTNPCLEFSSPLLGRLITSMLDCALK